MANYVCSARSNYFAVRDIAAFTDAMAPFEVEVTHHSDNPQLVGLLSVDPDGAGWPSYRYDDNDEIVDVDFPALIAEHLEPGHVAVLMEAGAEKLRYVVGQAIAVNHRGELEVVSLTDIYAVAKKLGEHITAAEY